VVVGLLGNEGTFASIGELALVGRPGGSAKMCFEDFTRNVVEIDVGFANREIVTGDRIITASGLATVMGFEGRFLWIQTDAATRLNAGILKYRGPVKLIRQVLKMREVAGCIAGDIVDVQGKRFLVRAEGDVMLMEAVGDSRTVIPEAEFAAAAPVLVQRAGLPGYVVLATGRGMRQTFSVTTAEFRGKRVFPGDRVEFDRKQFTVIGEHAERVWLRPNDGAQDFVNIQPQALLDPDVVKIVELAGGDIRYLGG
jgi:hypothetical protein